MRALLLFILVSSSLLAPMIAKAQTGAITGRVVTEDGAGLPNVPVFLTAVSAERRAGSANVQDRTATDEDGNFKFTGLAPRVYSVSASLAKGYVPRPVPANERQDGGYHRIGANVTITMIKGGAITGKVTNSVGEPVIGVQVNATMARDAEGNPISGGGGGRQRFTDDRGVYRIYGLPPGAYVVYTRNTIHSPYPSPYDRDAPTYHPSGVRETAAEVTVTGGAETGGIDIRYRRDPGHVVSGSVTGAGEPSSPYGGINVTLSNVAAGVVLSSSNVTRSGDSAGFVVYGVPDGEYEIVARRYEYNNDEVFASSPRRIVVKGSDVGGIELKLLPMGSITGKFALEAAPVACESKRKSSLEEALLVLRYETKPAGDASGRSQTISNGLTDKGEFTVYNLGANRYFLEPRLPNENWYVKTITSMASTSAPAGARSSAARAATPVDVARNGIALKAGEKISGVTVTIADGAAGVSGKVTPAGEGSRLPARLRIHLVPAAATAANEVLRYAEALVRSDGSFSLSNLAPGKYWLIARATPGDEMDDRPVAPAAWDANERAKLRKEAEALKIEIALKPCQRVTDQVVKYSSME